MPKGVYKRIKVPVEQRFWAKVDKDGPIPAFRPDLGPCWVWLASDNGMGYGQFGFEHGKSMQLAHRVSYQYLVGPIPDETPVLDHLCRVTMCVNPEHLEPVTYIENTRRGGRRALKEPCVNGHPWESSYIRPNGTLRCHDCALDQGRDWWAKNKDRANAERRAKRANSA